MRCSQCNEETNENNDHHCRIAFMDNFERLQKDGDIDGALKLIESTKFKDKNSNIWKDDFYKKIEKELKENERNKVDEIVLKISQSIAVEDSEVKTLEENKKFSILSMYFLSRYKDSDDLWDLSKACSYLRKDEKPEFVIQYTENLDLSYPVKDALSAVLTSRGAALMDIGNIDKAKETVIQAIDIHKAYHTYQALAKIYAKEGDLDSANECMEEAKKLKFDSLC